MQPARHAGPEPAVADGVPADSAETGHQERRSRLRRRAYLAVVLFSTVLLVWLSITDGLSTPYWGVAYPALAAHGLVLLVLLWCRRISLRALEAWVLGPLVAVLLGFLAVWRVVPDAMQISTTDLFLVMLWAGLSFPFCFLLLGTLRGLQASVGIYTVFLVLILPPAIQGGLPDAAAGSASRFIISLAVFFAVTICLLWVLASRLEELASARTEARLFAEQAVTDPLTGLVNRRQLDDDLGREIARARRHPQPLSLVLVDLDRFKEINDGSGHEAGDRVLIEVARRLALAVRAIDVVGRWGGEEFLVILPQTGHDAALELAERCRSKVADTPFVERGRVTASFGVATLAAGDDARSLLRRADDALYLAKDRGRDRVVGVTDAAGSAHGPAPVGTPPLQ